MLVSEEFSPGALQGEKREIRFPYPTTAGVEIDVVAEAVFDGRHWVVNMQDVKPVPAPTVPVGPLGTPVPTGTNPLAPKNWVGTWVLLGLRLVQDDMVPFGDVVRPSVLDDFRCSAETYASIRAQSNGMVQSIAQMLREAARRGDTVVSKVVSKSSRPGTVPSMRPRKANLDDLADRCKSLVMQMAAMLDDGPIPPGTLQELQKSYSALQTEMDGVRAQFDSIDSNLSMMRGVIIESVMSDE